MSDNNHKKQPNPLNLFKLSLLNLFLLFMAVLQGSAQLLELFLVESTEPSLLNVWIALGNLMSENWVAVSLSLIFCVLGYFLYNRVTEKQSSRVDNAKTVVLSIINLALCLRVYSTASLSEKITFISEHLPTVIIVFVIVSFVTITILVIRKERKNAKELDARIKEASRKPRDTTPGSVPSADNAGSDHTPRNEAEKDYQLKHPFSYAYRSYIGYLNEKRELRRKHKQQKRELRREHRKEILRKKFKARERKIEKNTENPEDIKKFFSANNIEIFLGGCSIVISMFICGLLVYWFARTNDSEVIATLEGIPSYILKVAGILKDAEASLTDFLRSSGSLFLLGILFLTIFLLVYAAVRVVAYLLVHIEEDTEEITKIGKAIKAFVFGIMRGTLRPLLFLPDFLECVETMLLDTDIDEKINEVYLSDESQNKDTEESKRKQKQ